MKKLNILTIALLLFTLVSYGQNQKTEEYYKNYILANYNAKDPIVGIYTYGGFIDKYMGGELKQHQLVPASGRYVIIRKGSCFVIIDLAEEGSASNECGITATTVPNVFLDESGLKMKLSDGTLTSCKEQSQEAIAKLLNVSVKDIVSLGVRFNVCGEYTKIFPTQWDIENFKASKE